MWNLKSKENPKLQESIQPPNVVRRRVRGNMSDLSSLQDVFNEHRVLYYSLSRQGLKKKLKKVMLHVDSKSGFKRELRQVKVCGYHPTAKNINSVRSKYNLKYTFSVKDLQSVDYPSMGCVSSGR